MQGADIGGDGCEIALLWNVMATGVCGMMPGTETRSCRVAPYMSDIKCVFVICEVDAASTVLRLI